MPFLRFSGFAKPDIVELAPRIVQEVARTAKVQADKVKLELIQMEAITNHPPYIEISLFHRDQEVYDAIALWLSHELMRYGYENAHIYFVELNPEIYYKQGHPLMSRSHT